MARNAFADHTRRVFLRIAGSGLAVLAVVARPDMSMAQMPGPPLKIGMVGAGREGGTLGTLFVKAGHPGMFSSRHPEELKGLVAGLGSLAQAGTVEQAIAFGDVVVIAVPYTAIEQIGKDHAGTLIREIGFEPVLVGGLAMGRHLVPGTPLGGEHTPAQIRQIAGSLQ